MVFFAIFDTWCRAPAKKFARADLMGIFSICRVKEILKNFINCENVSLIWRNIYELVIICLNGIVTSKINEKYQI